MAATFRTRPWLLASSARPASLPAFSPSRLLLANMQQSRYAATRSKRMHPSFRASIRNVRKSQDDQEVTSSLAKEMLREQNALNEFESAMLAPRTIVPLPPNKIEGWGKRFTYYKEVLIQRVMDRVQIMSQTWRLKDRFFSRAKLRAERKGVVEAALKLHAEMSSCLAQGGRADKTRLGQICIPKLHRSLVAAMETRPKGKSFKWQLLELKGKPFWPRIIDHKWTDLDIGITQSFRQAVVGIKSRQRLTEVDASGKEGKSKEMDVTEYLVLWRSINRENLSQSNWKIYGTLKETSFDELLKEKAMIQKMGDIMAKNKVEEAEKALKKS